MKNISQKNNSKNLTTKGLTKKYFKSNIGRISILLMSMLLFSFCTTSKETGAGNDGGDATPPLEWTTTGTFTTDGNANTSSIREDSTTPIQATVEITSNLPAGVAQKLTFVVDEGLSYFNKIKFSLSSSNIASFEPITAETSIIFNNDMKSRTIYFLPVDNDVAEMSDPIYKVKVKFTGQEAQLLGSLTVENNDTAGIILTVGACGTLNEGGVRNLVENTDTSCTFDVRLNFEPTAPVTVSFATTPVDDNRVTAPTEIFTFTADTWHENQPVTLTITDDDIAQSGDTTITVIATGTGGYEGSSSIYFTLTDNNDTAGITLTAGTCINTLSENPDTSCMFNVELTSEPRESVTVSFTTTPADTRLGTLSDVVFQPNEWSTPKPATLTITDDDIAQSRNVAIGIVANATDYTTSNSNMISFTLTSEEMLAIMLSTTTCTGILSEADGTCTFDVRLTGFQPADNVTVNLNITSDDRITASSTSIGFTNGNRVLTFTTGDWSTNQTVTLAINDDVIDQTGNTPMDATINIEATGTGGADSAMLSFMLYDNDRDVDMDNDGLIEVWSLPMLHNMRFDLAGASYKISNIGTGSTIGASTVATDHCTVATGGVFLCGYELTQNLDFDADGDGTTFIPSATGDCDVIMTDNTPRTNYDNCLLDAGDNNAAYFPVSSGSGGWLPIGDDSDGTDNTRFTAIFDGNGHTISNMSIKGNSSNFSNIGFLGYTGSGSIIRNIGMLGGIVIHVNGNAGGLVGTIGTDGIVMNSYTTGDVYSSTDSGVATGCLVGAIRTGGIVMNSYATGNVSSNGVTDAWAGGLVGINDSTIINSYATGDASSNVASTTAGHAGSLVGENRDTTIGVTTTAGTTIGSYRNMDATITAIRDGVMSTGNILGDIASITNFQTRSWYDTVGRWNTTGTNTAWDFTNVWQIVDGNYPTLRLK